MGLRGMLWGGNMHTMSEWPELMVLLPRTVGMELCALGPAQRGPRSLTPPNQCP